MAEFNENNVHIYIVDDDNFFLKIYKNKFDASSNYIIHEYTSGETLIEDLENTYFHRNIFYIVILDLFLKTKVNQDAADGNEILKKIKDIHSNIEVIMLSGSEEDEIVKRSIHLGAVAFIKKNENSFMRIHSNIKRIISKKILNQKKRRSITAILQFLSVILIISLALLFLYLYLPEYLW